MHPAILLLVENVQKHQHLLVPLLFAVLGTTSAVHSPTQHTLLITAVSWALIWIPVVFRAGLWSNGGSRSRRTTGWLAGAFLALGQICDRAACDKEGIWSFKGLLPVLVAFLSENDVSRYLALPSHHNPDDATSDPEKGSHTRSVRLLLVATVSAGVVLATRYVTPPTSALGLSSVVFTAIGLILFEGALRNSKDDHATGRRGFMSANGTFSRHNSLQGASQSQDQQLASWRDVAFVMTIMCGLAAYAVEPVIAKQVISWEPVYRQWQGDWKELHYSHLVRQSLWMICVNVFLNTVLFYVLTQQGAVHTSFVALFSYICARLHADTNFSNIWFTIIYGLSGLLFLYSSSSSGSAIDVRVSLRLRRIIFGVTAISIGLLTFRRASDVRHAITTHDIPSFNALSSEATFGPISFNLNKAHPAEQLITAAEKDFQSLLNKQSKSLAEAVEEYRRRNGIAPPPHFDKWYEFARRSGVVLIDEFDTISQALLPFWAVKPSTIRARVKLALGNEENALIGMMIRNGEVVKIENGQEWQQQATVGMMKDFVKHLPDMDLGFNIHDEPRVVVPHDQLSILVNKARDEAIPAAMKSKSPRNSFSPRPSDMNDGKRFEEATTSRFNRFAHQQTWTHAHLSCPVSSPARNYEENAADNLTSYAVAPLNYIYNQTAFSDICNSPSYATSYGFFERPNAFNIIHELTPVFSQSKISSFQDILYPSPWYWFGRVGYDLEHDTSWENKTNSLYWRGSTTGGFSRGGGWRRQHRQRIVRRLNAMDKAQIFVNKGSPSQPDYNLEEVERKDLDQYIDVKFSHVGQCDPGDCEAQKEFFKVVERADGQDAWYFKHLLDMDGNAFSGRFYAFLKSKSLTYKMSIFREWHQEWLKPWVHYVPMSLTADEHLDLVRWFGGGDAQAKKGGENVAEGEHDDNKGGNGDSIGEKKAREIAERSTEWAGKVLRNVDFETWFFRLLLEYGRIIDDNRDSIGYPGP